MMPNKYDEEAPDRKKSTTMQEARPIETETVTSGMIEDGAGAIGNNNATTSELEGLPEDEFPDELLELQQPNIIPPIDEELVSFHPTRKRFSRRSTMSKPKTDVYDKFPHDCYSFIALNGPKKNGMWESRERLIFFLFGLLPFVFQMLLLVLLAFSQTNELRGTIGETDNPDQTKNEFMGLFAKFIPPNSTPIIRVAQVVSLAAYVIFPSSSLQDIVRAVQLFPSSSSREPDHPVLCMRLSCILRATQGIAAMVVTLLLVLQSVAVVDIILNFTAVNFISGLDEDAFFLALTGDFSPALKSEAERIAATHLPVCMFKKDEARWKCYKWMTGLVYLFLFGAVTFIFAAQNNKSVWVTKLLRVQFQESTGLNQYSGCFEMNTTSSSVEFSRRTYHSFDTSSLNATFGYCREDRQWILFKGNTTDPCSATNDKESRLLARSSKTDTFDISTMFEGSWVSASNTPLSLYFFDGSNETDIRENCGLALDDGVCDPVFNELGYGFDGGDCCAATCTKSNCGRGGLTSVFGNSEVVGEGFENCVNSAMVPITIHLNNMSSSRDPQVTGWYQLSDAPFELQRQLENNNQFIGWTKTEPVKTYMSLDCNGKNVMTAYLDNSMVNHSQTFMVEDGTKCSLVIRNTTTDLGFFENDPIWYIGYTIFHNDPFGLDASEERVEILSGYSSSVETVEFTRIPECYFRKLGNHIEINSIYTGNSSSNQAINWLLGGPDPEQQCEDANFLERYALVTMNFALNPTKLFITSNEQCRWQSVNCNEGTIVTIQLPNQGLEGDVPSEIGLIANLTSLRLDQNELSSLPPQIGNLLSLQELNLDNNQLASLPMEIGNLSSLRRLDFDRNELESLPTEIGNLSSLQRLDLDGNLLTSLPTQIGKLKSLQYLDLNRNQITSLPPEFGNLTSLQSLFIEDNQLASLPTEIENLKNLQTLGLFGNQFTSLPSDNLDSLLELYLSDNQLQFLPPEIGKLSNLQKLHLSYNELPSLPSEIGDLTNLLELFWEGNRLALLPVEIGNLERLTSLYLWDNKLTMLPSEIGGLKSLQELCLWDNQLTSLPTEFGDLTSLERVYFDSGVTLPEEVKALCTSPEVDCRTL